MQYCWLVSFELARSSSAASHSSSSIFLMSAMLSVPFRKVLDEAHLHQ